MSNLVGLPLEALTFLCNQGLACLVCGAARKIEVGRYADIDAGAPLALLPSFNRLCC